MPLEKMGVLSVIQFFLFALTYITDSTQSSVTIVLIRLQSPQVWKIRFLIKDLGLSHNLVQKDFQGIGILDIFFTWLQWISL